LERRERGRERNAEGERLAAADERALPGILEPRRRQLDEIRAVDQHLNAAAEERLIRPSENGIERLGGRERFQRAQNEWTDRERRHIAGLLRRRRGREHQHDEERKGCLHRASPSPRRALRALTSPNPKEQVRPAGAVTPTGHSSVAALPSGSASFSSASSIAAGSGMPCCLRIAAMPGT